MLRRLSLPALGLLATIGSCPTPAPAGERGAYDESHLFKVTRNGSEIGSHRLSFTPTAEGLRVDVAVELRVGLGRDVTLYRYRHASHEIWRDGKLVRLNASTDANGKTHLVTIEPTGQGLRARASVPRADGGMVEGLVAGNETRVIDLPATVLPTSQWRRAMVERDRLFNTQLGKISSFRAERLGATNVATECGTLPATHYRLSGDLKLEIWFDDRDRWVKARFAAFDGSTVEYTLRCPPSAPYTATR